MEDNYFRRFMQANILTSPEVAETLQISRQRLSTVVQEGKLLPFKNTSQGMLFLRDDVEAYKNAKSTRGSENGCMHFSPIFDRTSIPYHSIKFLKENIHKLDEIDSIYIFFNTFDAILNNFYIPSDSYVVGELRNIDVPHFVARDIKGQELWLGCNCGYEGNGPRDSVDIIRCLIENKLLCLDEESEFSYLIKSNRVVKMFANSDKSVEISCQKESSDDFDKDVRAGIYYFKNRLVLLESCERIYSREDSLDLIEKYRLFLPCPSEILYIPTKEMSEELGYIGFDWNWGGQISHYNFIIRDSSGKELWLNPRIDSRIPLHKQDNIRKILIACGFGINEQQDRFSGKIMEWLDTTLHFVRPPVSPIIIRK